MLLECAELQLSISAHKGNTVQLESVRKKNARSRRIKRKSPVNTLSLS